MSDPEPKDDETPWLRLNPLMLIVSPVQELIRFFPIVITAVIWGTSQGDGSGLPWQWLGVGIPIALGIWSYLTTTWRITPTQVQLRKGLLSRNILVTPLDRVRSVELTATLIHRVLGLSRVRIGTGQAQTAGSESGFELDSLPTRQARELRGVLLHRRGAEVEDLGEVSADETRSDVAPAPLQPEETLLTFNPKWAGYAPLTASGLVVLGAFFALVGQFLGPALDGLDESDLENLQLAGWLLIALGLGAVVLAFILFPVLGYLVTNWGFTLSRDGQHRSYHIRRGLFTTMETSLERKRIRGLEFRQTILVRLAGAGSMRAIVSGLAASGFGDPGKASLMPLAPKAVGEQVAEKVLGTAAPFNAALVKHGRRAARRRWTRVGLTFGPTTIAAAITVFYFELWPGLYVIPAVLVVVGIFLAIDRYRRLGHSFTVDHLVVASGSLTHVRTLLAQDAIIGWNFQQSFFQRRLGIATMSATIAAGNGAATTLDIDEQAATALARQATPGLLEPFLVQ